ncbi:MAG: GTP-binding protein, partial [Actinobacteria bacterium]|nr:GTP-binding protein [Actinomycetota bacterium]
MSNSSCETKKVIGLVSGNGSGKTTLSECLLFNSGAIDRIGSIQNKNTVSDFSPLETKRGFSISSSILNYSWKGFQINLVDTPGYIDFIGQILSTIKVVDSILLLIDPKSGVQASTERIIEILNQNLMPFFCVINKLDQENVDYFKTVDEIRNNYHLNLVPITIPMGQGEKFSGIIDLLENKAYSYDGKSFKGNEIPISDEITQEISERHSQLVESIIETDDELLNQYLDGKQIETGKIKNVLKAAVLERKVIPTFAISSGKNIGVDVLMDYMNSLLPSPLERKPLKVKYLNEEKEAEIVPSQEGPVLAYVFKIMSDPYIGKLSIFRVFSGSIKVNGNYYISGAKNVFKFTNLFKLQGKDQVDITEASCGDIAAVSKIMEIVNDDTISLPENPLEMEKTIYPEPGLPKAITPVGKSDEEKISNGLARLIEEDPTLKQELNLEVHQNIVWGMGDLHLSIVKDKLKEKFDVEVDMVTPNVAYKETIKKDAK